MDSQNKIVFAVELGFTFTSLTSPKLVAISAALHSLRYKFAPGPPTPAAIVVRLPLSLLLAIRRRFGLPWPLFPLHLRQSGFVSPFAPAVCQPVSNPLMVRCRLE